MGQRIYLDNTNIQTLCEECGSEIFCCDNGKLRIVSLYGKVLCSRCSSGRSILPDVRIRQIETRQKELAEKIQSITREQLELSFELHMLKNSI